MRWPILLPLLAGGCTATPVPPPGPAPVVERGLGVLPPQGAPRAGCALFLYAPGPRPILVLAAESSTGEARIMLDGAITRLPFATFEGVPRTGFSPRMRYATEAVTVDLDLAMDDRREMTDGAAIEEGSLRIDRTAGDSIALPVKGIIACVPDQVPKR